jgi:hypothetical protein
MIRRVMVLLPGLFVALSGCTTAMMMFAPTPESHEAILSRDLACTIPLKNTASMSVAQKLTITFGDQSMSFDVQMQITPDVVDLVALDTLGRRALTIRASDDQIVSTAAPWVPELVRPADILADVAIVYASAESIAPALSACGASLTTTPQGRAISYNDENVIEVTYDRGQGWQRSARLANVSLGFQIDIKSVQLTP